MSDTLRRAADSKISSSSRPSATKPIRRVTLIGLIAATYFMVAGGPYGLEDVIAKAGYAHTLIILCMVPLLWSLPTALMVGELSSAIPSEGGYYVWVKRAMGPFWGFQEAWLTLAASVFDMAIYPTLFVSYLGRLAPGLVSGHNSILIGLGLIAACVLWNLFGAKAVGSGSVWLGIALLTPFVVLVVAAIRHHAIAPHPSYNPSADIVGGVMVAMWNFMGWDNASTVAGEVEDPQRTYPRAMLYAALAVVASYMIPVAAMWYAHVPLSSWSTGAWADVAGELGGSVLAVGVVVGGMISGAGMFNALSMSYSRLPLVIAEDGLLPRLLTRLNRRNVPWAALILCATAWALCLGLGFERLVQLDVLLYGASLMLEFVALVLLRIREPKMPRPFRVPGSTGVVALLACGPLALVILALVHSESERVAGMNALLFGGLLISIGMLLYSVLAVRASNTRTA